MGKSQEQRFWEKVEKTDACWVWTATLHNNGYGYMTFAGKNQPAHRISYTLIVGTIPAGLVIDHLCRNRACVNPAHLEPVTRKENLARGEGKGARALRDGICINGHARTPQNLRTKRDGTTCCKVCQLEQQARRRRERSTT